VRHGVRARVGVPVTSVHPEASIPRSFMRFLSCVTESSLRFSSSSISTIATLSSSMAHTGCHERTFSIYLSIYLDVGPRGRSAPRCRGDAALVATSSLERTDSTMGTARPGASPIDTISEFKVALTLTLTLTLTVTVTLTVTKP
jgi:hypothetical protein